MKHFGPKNSKVGVLGESIASIFLENKGFLIVEQNYLKKFGEIDIVAKKGQRFHFVEVKTISHESGFVKDGYSPEENVHPGKLKRIFRTIQAYVLEHREVGDWQFDVIGIFLNQKDKKATVRFTENVIV